MKHRVVNGAREEYFEVEAPTFEECKEQALKIVKEKGWFPDNCYNYQTDPDPYAPDLRELVFHNDKLMGCYKINNKGIKIIDSEILCYECKRKQCYYE